MSPKKRKFQSLADQKVLSLPMITDRVMDVIRIQFGHIYKYILNVDCITIFPPLEGRLLPSDITDRPLTTFANASHPLCIIYYGGLLNNDIDRLLLDQAKRMISERKMKYIIIMPFQTLYTKQFLSGMDRSSMSLFIPSPCLRITNLYCVMVAFNIVAPPFVLLSDDAVKHRKKKSQSAQRSNHSRHSDEYYTLQGSWNFLSDIMPAHYSNLFQTFIGKGHTVRQLSRLFPKKKIITMPDPSHLLSVREPSTDFQTRLKQSDIIITNPPFSQKFDFMEFFIGREKPFIMMCPSSAILTTEFATIFQRKEIQSRLGLLIPIFRLRFFSLNQKTKTLKPLKPSTDTLFLAWNVPELAGRLLFLYNDRSTDESLNMRILSDTHEIKS